MLWLSAQALREGTVEITHGTDGDAVPLVSSGGTVSGTRIRIVDPATRIPCPPDRVGEIWISGPCVAGGYLGRDEESEEVFRARTAYQDADAPLSHLRTGDLGFLHEEALYITGRLKDVIIRQGRNHYPQDIELSVERAVPGLHPNCAAAFSTDDGTRERLVLLIEADGRVLRTPGADGVRERVREAVYADHRLTPDDIMVVRRGTLSKTSSGRCNAGPAAPGTRTGS